MVFLDLYIQVVSELHFYLQGVEEPIPNVVVIIPPQLLNKLILPKTKFEFHLNMVRAEWQ